MSANVRLAIRVWFSSLVAASAVATTLANAQYCSVGSTFFSANYVAGCSIGSCWGASPFPGSAPAPTGSYPAANYACATSSPATAAVENSIYGYDGNGNLVSIKDPLGRTTTNSYDALNRLVQVLDAASGTTIYGYNGIDSLTQVTDPRNLTTAYGVNGFGDVSSLSSPDTGTTTTTYDPAGNVATRTDARAVTATYSYDGINRVTQVVYSKTGTPNEVHTFEYDGGTGGAANAMGHLTKLTDTAGTTAWAYEPHGRIQSKTQTVGAVTLIATYAYNAAGQLQTLTTPSGQQIGYTYLNNRVAGVTVNGQALITSATTEPFGPLSVWQWANAHYSYRDFDLDGRIAAWEHRNGVSILRNDLTIDAASRVTQITDPANAALQNAYQYDNLDRLTLDQTGNPVAGSLQYTYDAVGNRQTSQSASGAVTLTMQSTTNRLDHIVGAVDPGVFAGAGAVNFTYNNANRLIQIQADGVTVASYLINALGQRLQKSSTGTVTQFFYDEAGHLIGEYDASGNLVEETIWLEDLPVATLRPTGTGNPTPVAIFYVHPDHLGAPRAVTRPSDSAFVWRWDNTDPFGGNAPNENPSGLGAFKYNLRFPGQYYDAEIGTHYNYFRDYDPSLGRYVESDPIGLEGGLNTYLYSRASPLQYTDPTGHISGAAIVIGIVLIGYTGYEIWHHYSELVECKEKCKEKFNCPLNDGNTGPYHGCEGECVLRFWGGGKKHAGPIGPTPEHPIP